MKVKVCLLAVIILVAGCTPVTVAETAFSEVVSRYCRMPKNLRDTNRAIVNLAAYPNRVEIQCERDRTMHLSAGQEGK